MFIEVDDKTHKEMLALLVFHSTGSAKWATSKELRLAVANAGEIIFKEGSWATVATSS